VRHQLTYDCALSAAAGSGKYYYFTGHIQLFLQQTSRRVTSRQDELYAQAALQK
jgi:hypothetical protein